MKDWHEDLRARGYRLTPQRQLVLEAVAELGHATPEDVLNAVRRTASGVNVSTVYRTLELLENLGLVTHTHLGHGAPTYHLAEDNDHLHLVCTSCGSVGETSLDVAVGIIEALARTEGFTVDAAHFTISGLCRDCAAKG